MTAQIFNFIFLSKSVYLYKESLCLYVNYNNTRRVQPIQCTYDIIQVHNIILCFYPYKQFFIHRRCQRSSITYNRKRIVHYDYCTLMYTPHKCIILLYYTQVYNRYYYVGVCLPYEIGLLWGKTSLFNKCIYIQVLSMDMNTEQHKFYTYNINVI